MGNFLKQKRRQIFLKIKEKYKINIEQKGEVNSFYASLYYGIFNESFRRQHYSTLSGIKKFNTRGNLNVATLIRNLHRIEKGLIMPERRAIFAKDFIGETVSHFLELQTFMMDKNPGLHKYSIDILETYFKIIDKEDVDISRAYEIFRKSQKYDNVNITKAPFLRNETVLSEVNYFQFYQLTKQRRSVRFFLQKSVPRELIEKAVIAGLQSPSACNRQPFRLVIADDKEFKDQMGSIPMGAENYYKNVPVFIAIIGDLSNYFSERDRNLIYIDGSLFAMSFMLALETLGLSSCPINWPDIEEKEQKLAHLLNLKEYERCVMFIGLGFADPKALIPYSQKKGIPDIVQYNLKNDS